MKKTTLFFLIYIFISLSIHSQELVLFGINNSLFPIMSASFLGMKSKDSAITDLNINNFIITEMGMKRKIIEVSCEDSEIASPISTILTIDISGSMRGSRMLNAIEAAKLWINMMNLPSSECGIVTFSGGSSILQDITNDKDLLISKLNTIRPNGGTNYEAALWNTYTGALNMISKAKYQKSIVFLTDGIAKLDTYQKVIEECNRQGIKFYAITLDMLCPYQLKEVANQTGGKWVENIRSKDQLLSTYMEILRSIQKVNPCKIVWESEDFCSNPNQLLSSVNGIINFNKDNIKLSKDFNYSVAKDLLKSIKITPSSVNFGFVPLGSKRDTTIKLFAEKGDFDIYSIQSSHKDFSISPTGGKIKQGNNFYFTLTYEPSDTVYTFSNIEFKDPSCATSIIVSGGKFNAKPKIKTLKVTHPNGGEVFAVGSDTIVSWTGITSDDKVNLEYSTDKGYSWIPVANGVSNLSYNWNNIPNTPSNQCLMKATQISDEEIYPVFSLGEGKINVVKYNANGTRLAYGGSHGITIRDPLNGRALLKIANNTGIVNDLAFSPNGKYIASAGDGFMRVWNTETGNPEKKFPFKNDFYTVEFSPDGKYLFFGGKDLKVYIYETENWTEVEKLTNIPNPPRNIVFSPDGLHFAISDNSNTITVFNYSDFSLFDYISYKLPIYKLRWNDDNLIASEFFIYDFKISKIINEYKSKDIAFAGDDAIALIYDTHTSIMRISDWFETARFDEILYGNPVGDYSKTINQIAIGTDNHQSLIYNFNTNKIIRNTTNYYFDNNIATASPSLEYVALNSGFNLQLWLVPADTILKEFYYHKKAIRSIKWNSDSKFLAAGGDDNKIFVYDIAKMDTIYSAIATTNSKQSIVWNTAGTHLAYTNGVEIVVVEMKFPFEKKIYKFTAFNHKDAMPIAIDWSFDGQHIVGTYNNFNIAVWQIDNFNEPVKLFTSFARTYSNVMFSDDGKQIVVGAINHLIDFGTGIIRDIRGGAEPTIWSNDNKYLLLGNNLNLSYFYRLGTFKESFRVHNELIREVSSIENSKYFLTGSADGTIKIWEPESNIMQDDISDFEWKIVFPRIASNSIDMGIIPIGTYRDSLVSGFIKNIDSAVVSIDSISISGKDAKYFEIVSGNESTKLKPLNLWDVEFRFIADEVRKYNAYVDVYFNKMKQSVSIFGEGVEESIKIIPSIIDFDSVFVSEFKDTLVKAIIVNVGKSSIKINKTEFGVPSFDNFIYSSGAVDTAFVLNPGDSVVTQLRFSPKTIGAKSGVLQFYHDKPGSPANVELFGIGKQKGAQISTSASKVINLICEEVHLDSVIISNKGNSPLTISSFVFDNYPDEFSIVGDQKNIIIDTDTIYTLKYIFAPKSSGTRKTLLRIFNNSINDTAYLYQIIANKEIVNSELDKNKWEIGNLCLNEKANLSLKIKNTGTLSNKYMVKLPEFINVNYEEFELNIDEEISLEFDFTGKSEKFNIAEIITIIDTICMIEKHIAITGQVTKSEFYGDDIEITSYIGKSKETFINLENLTSEEITLFADYLKLPNYLQINQNIFPIKIKGNDKIQIPIIFSPNKEINEEIYLQFRAEPCENIDSIKIQLNTTNLFAQLEAGSGACNTGEFIEIPIYIKNKKNFEKAGINKIDFELKFNSTILEPIDFPNAKFEEKSRIIEFKGIDVNPINEIIAKVKFKAGLGNAEHCGLVLQNATTDSFDVHFDLKNGLFELSDICKDGGSRLIDFNTNQGGIISITPNPANEIAKLNVGFIEKSQTKISVVDLSGSIVMTLFDAISEVGTHEFTINLSKLSSGNYMIRFESPTIITNKPFNIAR